ARATELTRQLAAALDALRAADEDAARDVRDAMATVDRRVDAVRGNADGVPWDERIAANRTTIAQAIVDGLDDPGAGNRTDFYRGLLGEIDDPAGGGRRIERKILAFD
ncbi:MAG: alpha/beta hydrolase, partial [Actinomycetota bacterium]|nr:alpha/beta hydrolase [Actinomycetota bacterium]